MKIVHIITAFGIGGAEKLLLNVVNKQVEEHSVFLIYFKPIDDLIPFLDKRVNVYQVPLNLKVLKQLSKKFKNIEPDIIHTHLGHADLLGLWVARKTTAKLFCTMHNIYFKKNILDVVFFELYKFLFSKNNINVISISKSVENHVINRLKLPQKKSFLLYNAILQKEYPQKKDYDDKNTHLLFVGRLVKQKSIETLLKAVSLIKNKDIELTIVGEGKLKNKLILLTKKLKISSLVTFVGKQNNTDIFYNKADIFILPSIWEGFGIVILEAFRAKTAVISSNIEGPAELIKHKKNGLLFQPKNYKELAKQLKILIKNKDLRNKLAVNGFKSFNEKYSIKIYVKNLNRIYQNA